MEPDENGPDGFAVAAMQEVGLDIATHHPKGFDEVGDGSVDLIIAFTPQAKDRAAEFTRTLACDVEYWPVAHPAEVFGSREARLQAYPGGPGGPVFAYLRAFRGFRCTGLSARVERVRRKKLEIPEVFRLLAPSRHGGGTMKTTRRSAWQKKTCSNFPAP